MTEPEGYDPATDPVHGSGWNSAARWGGWHWRGPRDGEWFRTCSFCGCMHPQDLAPELVAQGPCVVCGETGWEACFYAQQPGWYRGARERGELDGFPPEEVARAEAMNASHSYNPGGAYASWADRKYGWPHKFYVKQLINREPDRLHVIGSRTHDPDRERAEEYGRTWIRGTEIPQGTVHHFRDEADAVAYDVYLETRPTLFAKFYTIHLADSAIADDVKEAIYKACGIRFTFTEDGRVGWERA